MPRVQDYTNEGSSKEFPDWMKYRENKFNYARES